MQPFSEIVEEMFGGKQRPGADRKAVGVCSAAAKRIEGNLKRTTWLPL